MASSAACLHATSDQLKHHLAVDRSAPEDTRTIVLDTTTARVLLRSLASRYGANRHERDAFAALIAAGVLREYPAAVRAPQETLYNLLAECGSYTPPPVRRQDFESDRRRRSETGRRRDVRLI